MESELTGEGALEQKREYLESGVLQLKDPDLKYEYDRSRDDLHMVYDDALSTQAIPVVDFLAQIKDSCIERKNNNLAEFNTTQESYVRSEGWNHTLQEAISDLARAADLKVSLSTHTNYKGLQDQGDNSQWKNPQRFSEMLDHLELPPALQARIAPRRDQIKADLGEAIKIREQQIEEVFNPSFAKSVRNIPGIGHILEYLDERKERKTSQSQELPTPDYRLQIKYVGDKATDTNYNQPAHLRHYIHTVSLASPSA